MLKIYAFRLVLTFVCTQETFERPIFLLEPFITPGKVLGLSEKRNAIINFDVK